MTKYKKITEAIETPFGMGTVVFQKTKSSRNRTIPITSVHLDMETPQGLTQNACMVRLKRYPDGQVEALFPNGIGPGLVVLNWMVEQAYAEGADAE